MTAQLSFFDGRTYSPQLDGPRLSGQLVRVREIMRDGQWRTLARLSALTGASEASVSARLRDLRKARFGRWTVDRRRVEGGLHEYRVFPGCTVQTDMRSICD